MLYFMVFKSPAEGRTHIFRPGEPMAQILVLPETAEFDLVEMTVDEQAERELRARRIHAARSTLAADTKWASKTNTIFDGTYRHILRAAKARSTLTSNGGGGGGGDSSGGGGDGGAKTSYNGGDGGDDTNTNRDGGDGATGPTA
jgi:hypothetical protein